MGLLVAEANVRSCFEETEQREGPPEDKHSRELTVQTVCKNGYWMR